MVKFASVFFAVAVLGAAGAWEFSQARRRADPASYEEIQKRFDAIPFAHGEWNGQAAAFDNRQIQQANAHAFLYRHYANKGGQTVNVLLLAGDPGEIGTHDPERCYGGAGYSPVGGRQRRELLDPVTAQPASYWYARFDTETVPSASVQVAWCWTADGSPSASDDARFEFVGRSVLYKLYVSRPLSATEKGSTADPVAEFLVNFLPALREAITTEK